MKEALMAKDKTPETFKVGETVTYYHGEVQSPVDVVAVDGDEVVANVHGELVIFAPRPSDGMHVRLGSPDHEVLPDMIYHPKPVPVKKKSRLRDVFDFLHGMFWGS